MEISWVFVAAIVVAVFSFAAGGKISDDVAIKQCNSGGVAYFHQSAYKCEKVAK